MHIEVLQFVTIKESLFSDAGDAFWQREFRQARAVVESIRTDRGEILQRQFDACHTSGPLESIVANSNHVVGDIIMLHRSWNGDRANILAFRRTY